MVVHRRVHHNKKNIAQILLFVLVLAMALLMLTVVLVGGCRRHYMLKEKLNIGYSMPTDYEVHGIDVSHHQGNIQWTKVKKVTHFGKHISFVFAKCTEGCSGVDTYYDRNRVLIRKNGFYFGAYHYFVPGRPADKQADNFIKHAHLRKGDLPPVLDVEDIGQMSENVLNAQVECWLKIVGEHYGCVPILYTSHSFKENYIYKKHVKKYPLWKAQYLDGGMINGKDWLFYQHTRHGHASGIGDGKKDYVDLDVFRGSSEDLKSVVLGGS